MLHPKYWLTDAHLSKEGEDLRFQYTALKDYLTTLPIKTFQLTRIEHLFQSFTKNILTEGFALPPNTINFGINNKCNLKCFYCDMGQKEENVQERNVKTMFNLVSDADVHMSLDEAKRIVDEVAWFRPVIRTCFLEPLLYKHFFELVDYVKSKGLPFSTLTNGLLLPKLATKIVEAGVDALRLSLDGPSERHDAMCGVKGTYDALISGVKTLIETREKLNKPIDIGFYYTLNDRNFDCMAETLEALDREGILDKVFFSFHLFTYVSQEMAEKHNEAHASACGITIDETSSHLVDINAIDIPTVVAQKELIQRKYTDKKYRIHFRPEFSEYVLTQALRVRQSDFLGQPCDVPWHSLYINPAGSVKVIQNCCLAPAGNVYEQHILDIWNGSTLCEQRKALQAQGSFIACQRCWGVYSKVEDSKRAWN